MFIVYCKLLQGRQRVYELYLFSVTLLHSKRLVESFLLPVMTRTVERIHTCKVASHILTAICETRGKRHKYTHTALAGRREKSYLISQTRD